MYSLFCVAEKIRTVYINPKKQESNESNKLDKCNYDTITNNTRNSNYIKELFFK